MIKSRKKMIIKIVLIILAIILLVVLIKNITNNQKKTEEGTEEKFVEINEEGKKTNISNKLNETKKYNGLTISDIKFTEQGGVTTLLANVKNDSGNDITDFTHIDIIFLDENQNEIGKAVGLIIPLQNGQETQLNAGGSFDYINAYDFKIVEHQS